MGQMIFIGQWKRKWTICGSPLRITLALNIMSQPTVLRFQHDDSPIVSLCVIMASYTLTVGPHGGQRNFGEFRVGRFNICSCADALMQEVALDFCIGKNPPMATFLLIWLCICSCIIAAFSFATLRVLHHRSPHPCSCIVAAFPFAALHVESKSMQLYDSGIFICWPMRCRQSASVLTNFAVQLRFPHQQWSKIFLSIPTPWLPRPLRLGHQATSTRATLAFLAVTLPIGSGER